MPIQKKITDLDELQTSLNDNKDYFLVSNNNQNVWESNKVDYLNVKSSIISDIKTDSLSEGTNINRDNFKDAVINSVSSGFNLNKNLNDKYIINSDSTLLLGTDTVSTANIKNNSM